MNLHHSPLSDPLAAEYVLGGLRGKARQRFERLLPAHPALRQAVVGWERRLNRLAGGGPPVTPPPGVWSAIERRLFSPPPRRSWWNHLPLWRGLALAGLLAAIIVSAPLKLVSPLAELPFAAIRGKQREVLWTVALAEDGRLHVNNLRAMAMPPDQRCFLWLKMGGASPVMLGALPDDGSARIFTAMPVNKEQSMRGELWVTMQTATPSPQPPAQPLYQTHWQAL